MMLLEAKKFERLQKAVEWSNRQLEFTRRKRLETIWLYVGSHYGEAARSKKIPVNHLKMAVDIYARALAPHAPRVLMRTYNESMLSIAADMELAVNQVPREIGLDATLKRWVIEALFSMGILKVGLQTVGNVLGHDYGQPFVDNVTIDDYFCDMSAKRQDLIQYEGNSYWRDYDEVKDAPWVDESARKWVKPDKHTVHNDRGERQASDLMVQESADEYSPRIWLRDVWLPKEKKMVTYGVTSKKQFACKRIEGPEPYVKLGFSEVPGNLLPLPPVQIWRDLHELANAVFRKLGNQADGEKSVLGFQGGNDEEIKSFQGAADGDGILYQGSKPEKLTAGGVNTNTLLFYERTKDLSSYFAGNLDSLGGLAQLTETVGQDKLLSEAASAQIRDMADGTIASTRKVYEALAHYEWTDPIRRRVIEKAIPGTDVTIPVQLGPENKVGRFGDLEIDIDIYSYQETSPGARMQKLGLIMQQYILPLAPIIEGQGGTIDVRKLLEYVARYSDMHEIKEIVPFAQGYRTSPQSIRNERGERSISAAAPQQPREYVHRSTGPSTQGTINQSLQNAMLKGGGAGE
jgi:hypothetical protein